MQHGLRQEVHRSVFSNSVPRVACSPRLIPHLPSSRIECGPREWSEDSVSFPTQPIYPSWEDSLIRKKASQAGLSLAAAFSSLVFHFFPCCIRPYSLEAMAWPLPTERTRNRTLWRPSTDAAWCRYCPWIDWSACFVEDREGMETVSVDGRTR